MRTRVRALVCSAVVAVSIFAALPARAVSLDVLPGWDMFTTDAGRTSFNPIPSLPLPQLVACQGVPIGTFTFSGVGTFATGMTDTIVQRFGTATITAPTVPIQLLKLQLQCGLLIGTAFLPGPVYVTLQSDRGRSSLDPPSCCPSTGSLSLGFDLNGLGGSATSTLTVNYDVRLGSPNGPIINLGGILLEDNVTFTATASWVHALPTGQKACLDEIGQTARHGVTDDGFFIGSVNAVLNAVNTDEDFHYGVIQPNCALPH